MLVFRDVTERRGTEHERLNLIAELEAAVRARDDFLSIASHELRNPVNALQLQLVGVLRAYQRATDEVRPDELRDRKPLDFEKFLSAVRKYVRPARA